MKRWECVSFCLIVLCFPWEPGGFGPGDGALTGYVTTTQRPRVPVLQTVRRPTSKQRLPNTECEG